MLRVNLFPWVWKNISKYIKSYYALFNYDNVKKYKTFKNATAYTKL